MQKKQWVNTTVGTYRTWEMPELKGEIPALFAEAGKAKVVKTAQIPHWVCVEVTLKQPAKVIDWRNNCGDGLAINSDTYAIIACRNSVSPSVTSLPRNGDKKVTLWIHLELDTFKPNETVTLDDLRAELRKLAEAMNKTWYYHFK